MLVETETNCLGSGCVLHELYRIAGLSVTTTTPFVWGVIQLLLVIFFSFTNALHTL
jgi:hypothetical protein